MSKFALSALVALSAALSSQSIHAQGQSSGEDTQRRDQQQQQQSSSAQSSASSAGPSSQGGQFDVKNSSSQNSGAPGQTATGSDQSRSSSATYNSQSQPGQQPASSTGSNDAFKSDTSATGRLSAQSAGQSGQSSQGAPGSSQSSTTRLNTSATAGANAQVNQQHVTQFQNVFSSWQPGANAEAQLTAAINAAAPGARIDRQYVTRFVTDFNAITPRAQLSPTAQQRLATAFATVLTPTAEVTTLEPTLTEVRQALVESGLSPIQAQTVACDLHLMAAQVHPNMLEAQVK